MKKKYVAKALLNQMESYKQEGKTYRFMEVCGTHTVSIFREGIRQLLPKGVHLLAGPGCPVCVTDQYYMDTAMAYAMRKDMVLVTFGDMLRVPGTHGSLWDIMSMGGHVESVYSPLEIISISEKYPDKKIVFLAIGFETTIAILAATMKMVYDKGLQNIFFLVSHKLVPPALEALLQDKTHAIDGFILPGHVSVIIGEKPYEFVASTYQKPAVIAGFQGLEILEAIAHLMKQTAEGTAKLENLYRSVVAKEGNPMAQTLMRDMYTVVEEPWRGFGRIPNSGLRLKAPYDALDVEVRHPLSEAEKEELLAPLQEAKEARARREMMTKCECASIVQGIIEPVSCSLFGKECTPENPVGACMVSVEGACSAWYRYGAHSGGMVWKSECD